MAGFSLDFRPYSVRGVAGLKYYLPKVSSDNERLFEPNVPWEIPSEDVLMKKVEDDNRLSMGMSKYTALGRNDAITMVLTVSGI